MESGSTLEASSLEESHQNFEQGVAYLLHLWPALTLAVQNHWGGPDSADKRDWFAGAVVELFPNPPKPTKAGQINDDDPDLTDVETVLLQIMLDEFEVNVDDDSALEVADQILRVRAECLRGKYDEVAALRTKWESKKGSQASSLFKEVEDQDNDTDWDPDDSGGDDEGNGDAQNGDIDMGEAPLLAVKPQGKAPPEVDGDGFTTVTRKKR